jgi:hypothetical protein
VVDRPQQVRIPHRFGPKIGGAGLHRMNGHCDVAVGGDEDNGQPRTKFALQPQAVSTRMLQRDGLLRADVVIRPVFDKRKSRRVVLNRGWPEDDLHREFRTVFALRKKAAHRSEP